VEPHVDREVLWQALGGLSPRQRAVLVLRQYEGLSDAEIAELIGVAQASVRSLSARALDKLRRDAGLRGWLEGVR
jgi:RNA polymerase sigma factor (sigma-70 family)